jgi:molybdenum cofactor biosynthesis protein B
VFCLPGSENAVRLGVDEIILHEVGHLVGLAGRGLDDEEGEEAADNETGDEAADGETASDSDASSEGGS